MVRKDTLVSATKMQPINYSDENETTSAKTYQRCVEAQGLKIVKRIFVNWNVIMHLREYRIKALVCC